MTNNIQYAHIITGDIQSFEDWVADAGAWEDIINNDEYIYSLLNPTQKVELAIERNHLIAI